MRCLFYVLIEQDLPIDDARYFLSTKHLQIRDAIINATQSEPIHEQWLMLTENKRPEHYLAQLESTANRLFKFVTHPTIRRLMSLNDNTINLEEIINKNQVLLVNLQTSSTFSKESSRIIGTLLVNEIWEIMRQRTRDQAKRLPRFYLIMDEFQEFATPDIGEMLDQGAKYGLHLMLFHQFLDQLDRDLRGSLSACHTRFVFGGVSRTDTTHMFSGTGPSFEAEDNDSFDDVKTAILHPPRHYTLRRPEQPLVHVIAPLIHDYETTDERVENYVDKLTAGYPTPEEVDRLLQSRPAILPAPQESPRTRIFSNAQGEPKDEDFFE
jgi:TraM recognition site of TraD and TraG